MINQIQIALSFLSALIAGQATFSITIAGKKYQVSLQNNGVPTAPNLSAISQLTAAAISLPSLGLASTTVKIGANNWTVSVTAA